MKKNSDDAIRLITVLTNPPHGMFSKEAIDMLVQLGEIIKDMDAQNLKLGQEVQMLRAVLEQDRDKVC